MGVLRSLVDKAQAKKRELERKAAQKAAEEAATLALARGKRAALAAMEQAGQSLKSAGASIEAALFGPGRGASGDPEAPAAGGGARAEARPASTEDRAAQERRLQREVDEELAAMKRRLGK
jgi:hypothetical protein